MSESDQTPQTRSTSTSVVYRHVTLRDGAELQVHEDKSVFVALEEPPPIRTIVQLWRGDEARAVMVDRIIETPDAEAGEVRGFFGIPADDEAIARATRVGTETLEPTTHAADDASGAGGGSDPGEGNINMAMPAPVVVHDDADDSGAHETGEGAEDAPVEDAPVEDAPVEDAPVEDAPAEDAPVEDAPAEAAADGATESASDASASQGSGRRKRGKGRKKRK